MCLKRVTRMIILNSSPLSPKNHPSRQCSPQSSNSTKRAYFHSTKHHCALRSVPSRFYFVRWLALVGCTALNVCPLLHCLLRCVLRCGIVLLYCVRVHMVVFVHFSKIGPKSELILLTKHLQMIFRRVFCLPFFLLVRPIGVHPFPPCNAP